MIGKVPGDVSPIVGMTCDEAKMYLAARKLQLRVTSENGRPLPVTADARCDRVNVAVEDGVVTDASIG